MQIVELILCSVYFRSRDRTDFDVIRENHKFLWNDDDDDETWGKRLAKKYYDKLFKEYCIADLSRYKENKIALRWRIESEVVSGKGKKLFTVVKLYFVAVDTCITVII